MSSSSSKFKNFSEKYPLFKKLYFFYNIYIRNYKFYFKTSQFDEDKQILKNFPKNYSGIYLDVGAFHPIKVSNTYRMYKNGWKGINIDMNPFSIELFKYARPKDINICAAISNKESYQISYFHNDQSPLNTIDKNHTKFLKSNFGIKDLKKKRVKTKTLNKILKSNNIKKIDFFNIDIEGHELEVIKSIDFNQFDIKVICVEILNHNESAKKKSKILLDILKKENFKLKYRSPINYIFKKIN
jgi:FkbM family methyltransferase